MNIFYINSNPITAAKELCDEHIRKMQIESAQMLCTAHWATGGSAPYKKAHLNHPSTIWTRSSIYHYNWLVEHGLAISREFEFRYEKRHKTQDVLEWCKINLPLIPNNKFIPPPQCMPDKYKNIDTVEAYKNYYYYDKIINKGLHYVRTPNLPKWIIEKTIKHV
jgi:hypothetical protein